MRFSLLSLLALVTIAGMLISVGTSYTRLRSAEEELVLLNLEIDSLQPEANHFQQVSREFAPVVEQQSRMLQARQGLRSRIEEIFESRVEEESRVIPVEGMVSIRSVPSLERPGLFEQSYMIHVAEGRTCRVRLEFSQEQPTFIGFEPEETFELKNGLNKLTFRYEEGEQFVAQLQLNDKTLVTADADASDDGRGFGAQRPRVEKQKDIGNRVKPLQLLRFSPSPTYDGIEHEIEIKLTLLPSETNASK